MSIHQMSFVWYATNLKPQERLVALALADFADDHGRCWPSYQTISEKIGYSHRNVRRVMHDLRELGYIEILIPSRPKRTPLYQLRPDVLERLAEHHRTPPLAFAHPDDDLETIAPERFTDDMEMTREDNLSPLDGNQGGQNVPPGRTELANREDRAVPLSVIEPSEDPSSEEGGQSVPPEDFRESWARVKVEERIAAGLKVASKPGLIRFWLQGKDPEFDAEVQRLWAHRDHDCDGGYVEQYTPGAGMVKVACTN